MADTIVFSDKAPQVDGDIHFTFADGEFDLGAGGSYEVPSGPQGLRLRAEAETHPYLSVEYDPVDSGQPEVTIDPTDPHQNPGADHLSAYATQEAVDAAAANEEAIRREAYGDASPLQAPDSEDPTVTETLEETFDTLGVDAEPQVPSDEQQPASGDSPGTPQPPADPNPPTEG